MMMADVGFFDARRRDPHIRSEPEDHLERADDGLAIVQIDDVRIGARRRRGLSRLGLWFRG